MGPPPKKSHTAWKASGGGAVAQLASLASASTIAMWDGDFPCRSKFCNRAWLGGTAKRANAFRQRPNERRCCAHSTHPKWTRPSAERRRPNQLCVTPGRSGRNGFHLANFSSGAALAAVAAWAGSARGRRRLAGAASGAPGSGGRSRLAGAAAEPTSLAGALADSLEGVAAEACAAGARVGVWTCVAGISARNGGRGHVIRAASPGQGRAAGSLAEDKHRLG